MKDLLTIGFILTATMPAHSTEEGDALRAASRAFYKQSGTEAELNAFVKKEVPKELQTVAGNLFLIVKTLEDRRLSVSWSF